MHYNFNTVLLSLLSYCCCQGDTIASCDSSGCVVLWDVRSTTPLKTIDCGPSAANMVAFDPPGILPFLISVSVSAKQSIRE